MKRRILSALLLSVFFLFLFYRNAVISGALEGLSKGGQSLIISLLRYILFIIPLAFVLCKAFGPQCVFHAFWITEILTAAIAALLMKSSLRLPGTQA